ncbi:hypothetical protein MC7420_2386 [Coleofasciculus chthonoplastes PCC 7420]|uniref:Uncharacterized protein n=1 Tax=Coleofasciculus chthonoplastes PCC 7420 TaxID=118168 RepID=B4W2B2_9CYAN|nr:hypothetical protein [Coleofasciculus chthonoplastes]EDX71720.1 hypothetical protein MC7420_2386 [Coleofasciculus chthonoplastes PCC 7420]
MSNKFQVAIYTSQQLSDPKKMQVLWRLLDDPIVSPKRYDSVERAKISFSPDAVESAAQLYQNEGLLFVRGKKDGFLGVFSDQLHGLSKWDIWLNVSAMQGKKRKRWLNWIFSLCGELPVLYGGGFPMEEYDAKHTNVKKLPGGGRISGTIGVSILEFYQYLPGLYWLTIFGTELVRAFGESKLLALPKVESFSLDSHQVAICLNEPVLPDNMEQRLHSESQLADLVGAQFFFDRNRTGLQFEQVPQLAKTLKNISSKEAVAHEDLPEPGALSQVEFKNFGNQVILSPDGIPYANPSDLAEQLVVFLHTDVEEVFTYSRSALEKLDTFFTEHPQKLEYKEQHLQKEFIPALGAYLGEVIVQELGGDWLVREPLLKSTVTINDREVAPFQYAYQVVYDDKKLLDLYNSMLQ